MATLGDLERAVMDELWGEPSGLTARAIVDRLAADAAAAGRKPWALTTVLTVLSRLEDKDFIASDRDLRPRVYRASGTLAEHTATLMTELLDASSDREAALARFVGNVDPSEVDTLRRLLEARLAG